MCPFVEGTQQAAAATAGLEEYAGAGAATDLHDAMVSDGVFCLNAFWGHSEFGMETVCGASGVAANDLPAATFLDGVFTNALGGHSDFGMETFCGASGDAATDLLAAMFFDGAFRLHEFEGHGRAASVLGDTGSAFSRSHWLIHDSFANSLHHPIHACAHSRLDRSGVGFGVCGVGVACPPLLSLLCVSRVDDDVDDACMDGSNSLIQGSGCHATACAFSDALQNSRQDRGHCLRGGTKCSSMGSGTKVWLSDEIRGSLSHQKPGRLHVETWAGAQECPPPGRFPGPGLFSWVCFCVLPCLLF